MHTKVNIPDDKLQRALLRQSIADKCKRQKPKRKNKLIYITSNSQWFDLQPYIEKLKKAKYIVTNTALQDRVQEMYRADCVITLRGWDTTAIGRELREKAILMKKPFVSRMIFIEPVND